MQFGSNLSTFSLQELVVPWKGMATSLPAIAILVANITTDWGLYTLLTSIPTYMNEVLKLDISAVSSGDIFTLL